MRKTDSSVEREAFHLTSVRPNHIEVVLSCAYPPEILLTVAKCRHEMYLQRQDAQQRDASTIVGMAAGMFEYTVGNTAE